MGVSGQLGATEPSEDKREDQVVVLLDSKGPQHAAPRNNASVGAIDNREVVGELQCLGENRFQFNRRIDDADDGEQRCASNDEVQGRQNPQYSSEVELGKRDRAVLGEFTAEQCRDEIPAQKKEHRDPEATGNDVVVAEMGNEDDENADSPDSVQGRNSA